jgi:hypothetical protein
LLDLQMLAQASLEGLVFSTGGNVLHEVLRYSKEVCTLQLQFWSWLCLHWGGNTGFGGAAGDIASAVCCMNCDCTKPQPLVVSSTSP